MQHVARIDHLAANPVGDVLAKPAPHLRFIPALVRLAQVLETCLGPITNRHHHVVLVNLEALPNSEVEASLPGVPETVGPLPWIAIGFAPEVFLRPAPSLLFQRQDKLQNVGLTFSVHRPLFDIQDEGALRLQDPFQFLRYRQEQFHIPVNRESMVRPLTVVRIRRRRNDQVNRLRGKPVQDCSRITQKKGIYF